MMRSGDGRRIAQMMKRGLIPHRQTEIITGAMESTGWKVC
jgi:hypothetical protein